jgi:hypothetical protein
MFFGGIVNPGPTMSMRPVQTANLQSSLKF